MKSCFWVAFSCALRRDKLDGSESWDRFGSTPNLLRSSGSRPWTAFAGGGARWGLAHQTFCEIRARGPVSLFCEWGSGRPAAFASFVAFSCALRRDKLDGSESWPGFGSTPNLLRPSGSRPWTAFAGGGARWGLAHQTFCEIRARGPVSLFCEWDSGAAGCVCVFW